MIAVPDGSIYYWMFSQGLKQVPLDSILAACNIIGKSVRNKDIENYWNGWYRSGLKRHRSALEFGPWIPPVKEYFTKKYDDYPIHPFLGLPEIEERFVPTYKNGRPIVSWKDTCFTKETAEAFAGSTYVSENLKGCKFIVIDCDGDHSEYLDLDTINFLWDLGQATHILSKPKHIPEYDGYDSYLYDGIPASFHLTFRVDRLIPTMHFPKAHIDILGNTKNTLRCFKNKVWNNREPIDMTDEIWEEVKTFIRKREENQ